MPGRLVPGRIPARGAIKQECAAGCAAVLTGGATGRRRAAVPAPVAGYPGRPAGIAFR